jgi:hypothetical protein
METYTRQQLHDLVWSGPLREVAKKLGLSDNGLRKHCVKAARFKGGPQGTAKRRGVGREPKATETSGLEDDARAGISPTNSKPLVLAF